METSQYCIGTGEGQCALSDLIFSCKRQRGLLIKSAIKSCAGRPLVEIDMPFGFYFSALIERMTKV